MSPPNGDTVGAIFRVHLVSSNPDTAHHLEKSRIDTVWRELANPARRFPGLTVFYDNTYIAAAPVRTTAASSIPTAACFSLTQMTGSSHPVPALTTGQEAASRYIYIPAGLAVFPGVKDFLLVQSSEGVSYGAIWLQYQVTSDFEGGSPSLILRIPTRRGVDFIRPNRFLLPRGVAIDNDRT